MSDRSAAPLGADRSVPRTAITVALGALLLLAGCGSSSPDRIPVSAQRPDLGSSGGIERAYAGTPDRPRVLVGGDSITEQARDRIHDRLGEDHLVKVDAVVGQSWSRQPGGWDRVGCGRAKGWPCDDRHGLVAGALLADAPGRPDVVVLALGTNDAWLPTQDVAAAKPVIEEVLAAFRRSCVVGVTATEHSDAEGYDTGEARQLNALIEREADQVVPWHTIGEEPGMTKQDDIHPTRRGVDAWVGAVAEAVDACTGG